jgi:DNA-binding transcriptional LysR family regulator
LSAFELQDGLELRHLRYFLALATELHFGKAAETLSVTQPLLSRQIRDLERLVGVPLLARTRPVVELTPAGEQFFFQAQQTLQQAERSVRLAHRANGTPAHVNVAVEPCSSFHSFVKFAVLLKQSQPDLHIDVTELPVTEHAHRLRSGEVDIAYAHRNQCEEDITFTSLGFEPLLIALARSHPLAQHRSVNLKILGEEPFVFWPRDLAPACHDYILGILNANGITPTIQHRVPDHRKLLVMVAAGLGWSITPACARRAGEKGLAFRPMEGVLAKIEFGISHLTANKSRQLNLLLHTWQESVRHENAG